MQVCLGEVAISQAWSHCVNWNDCIREECKHASIVVLFDVPENQQILFVEGDILVESSLALSAGLASWWWYRIRSQFRSQRSRQGGCTHLSKSPDDARSCNFKTFCFPEIRKTVMLASCRAASSDRVVLTTRNACCSKSKLKKVAIDSTKHDTVANDEDKVLPKANRG